MFISFLYVCILSEIYRDQEEWKYSYCQDILTKQTNKHFTYPWIVNFTVHVQLDDFI